MNLTGRCGHVCAVAGTARAASKTRGRLVRQIPSANRPAVNMLPPSRLSHTISRRCIRVNAGVLSARFLDATGRGANDLQPSRDSGRNEECERKMTEVNAGIGLALESLRLYTR